MKKNILIYLKNFLLCGIIGWTLECIWTGLSSLFHKDRKLLCRTSIWMFPIYGMSILLLPIHKMLQKKPMILRGIIYTLMIYCTEFTSGYLLKRHNACPWDYSKAKFNVKGIIRFDYIPAWFFMGLLYEKILDFSTSLFRKS